MKTNIKHTKGKWRACCLDAKPHYIFAEENKTICSMFCNEKDEPNYESLEGIVTKEECIANAKLIATAPELLTVLIFVKNILINAKKGQYDGITIRTINNVIKKAIE